MYKFILSAAFFIISMQSFSQSVEIDSASQKGKYYLIYPDHSKREIKLVNALSYTEQLNTDLNKLQRYTMPYLLDFNEKHHYCTIKIKFFYGEYPIITTEPDN